ncbi:5,10-methylenetetrahydrofolate reductase [Saccharopolyspora rhizosphaerae]|uniref:Methylenetetrahydrofolate reductase n=1 Tax=Saccharopolyspora rhizosphaerae TaxID=2492662 RepID=A0A3R8P220_9PSEU|nr:methylenetetrahydrofolate reductase [Saccharopolyspora rhizosphaerae]RRO18340.1 5,10-methylenetetrahydrofolate reductase [Saccharopolyspora rhizosphaerae]
MASELRRSLDRMRYEVLPVGKARLDLLDPGSTVTVTASPVRGIEPTLAAAERLSANGLHAVPHLAARSFRDHAHLATALDRLDAAGVSEVFVIAGDGAHPLGEFADSLALLRAMEQLGRLPARIGIAGYPEGHAFLPDDCTVRAMEAKARYADYVVSQITFDARTITEWARDVRLRGVQAPVYVGVPGVVDAHRLLRIALKIGLGESTRFLRKQYGAVSKMLARYTPEDLFDELSPQLADPESPIAGWHLFTFNEISGTVQWRDDLAVRLSGYADRPA